MTAKFPQSLFAARGLGRSVVPACSLAVAALCAMFCAGCQEKAATGYHEYTGNGKSQESIVPKEDTTQATPTAKPAETTKAGKSEQPVNSNAAKPVAVATVDAGDAPVLAPKPQPGNAAVINSLGAGQATIATPVVPRKPKVLVTERKFQVAGPENAIRVSYDDLDLMRVLNMEPVTPDALSMMPEWLKSLDGKRVRLRGFMFPGFESHDLAGFGFARDNAICCFVRKPKVYDVFQVKLRDGVTADFVANRPVDVVGVFHFLPDHEDWEIAGMYSIDDATVIDKR